MGKKILDHSGNEVEHGRQRLSTGVRIHYYTAGTGPPVLLQHGIPKTSYYWRKVIPHLTPFYKVVVPDLRGFGDSSRPLSGYDMGTVADDIAELMTALGHDKFHLIGEDWGGAAGYQVAVRHPARINSLVFQEMILPGFGLEEWAKPHATHAGPHLWQVGFYHVPDIPEFLLAGREKEYFEWFLKNETYDPSHIDDDAVEEYASKFAQPGGVRGMCAYFREPESLKQNHESAKKMKLTLPVLAIGVESFIGKEARRQMERVAENVEYTEFKFGHQLAEECPEILSKRYLAFLQSL